MCGVATGVVRIRKSAGGSLGWPDTSVWKYVAGTVLGGACREWELDLEE